MNQLRSLYSQLPNGFFSSRRAVFCVLIVVFGLSTDGQERVDDGISYTRDIRPILSDKCFSCHGPDANARQADLRLDTQEGQRQDLGGYAAVVPGQSESSLLVELIETSDADLQMPPQDSKKQLNDAERKLLREWIDQGASWQQHWSFVTPKQKSLPAVADSQWCANEIDYFILHKLERGGLRPSDDAAPYTLVRRLFLDLIGLPPTPEQADYWVQKIWEPINDSGVDSTFDSGKYEQLVDFLLASPSYGERWARPWLDLARYADTNGYEKDRERSIWPYRDWVIDALNADMPFDQFTIEQIAGDMLPHATLSQIVATGFHRNTMLNEEGGIDPLEFRYHAMTDRVATTGTTWLGLTLTCAQCHSHKYDPVTQTDYYQLMALLNNADELAVELPSEDAQVEWAQRQVRAQQLLSALPTKWPASISSKKDVTSDSQTQSTDAASSLLTLEESFSAWRSSLRPSLVDWCTLQPTTATSNLPILTIEDEGVVFASGDTAKRDDYYLEFEPLSERISAIQLEALPDPRLPSGGPGSTYYEGTLGDFFLAELELTVNGQAWPIASASETFAANRFGKNPVSAALAIDSDVQTGWAVHGRQAERHVAVFNFAKDIPAGEKIEVHMVFGRHFASSLGKFRFRATAAGHEIQAEDFTPPIRDWLLLPDEQLSSEQRQLLLQEFCMRSDDLASESEEIRSLLAPATLPSTLIFSERPPNQTRDTFRHHRGEYLSPREKVEPGIPELFSYDDQPKDRYQFAQWLVSQNNPLTSRVCANRQWAYFFGSGIVQTVDDLGLQGTPPSHAELLDYLAYSLINQDNWSIKNFHRRIVTSHTYRQSAVVNQLALQLDPQNRWLAYAPRYRLDAEVLRDSILFAVGALSNKMGGQPVRPPQPPGITEVTFGSPKWNVSQGSDRYRRSIYTFQKRTAPFAMFATFDAPSGEACIARRTRSNNALQALTLMNDPMVVEVVNLAAAHLASTTDIESNPDALSSPELVGAIESLFRRILTRRPTERELQILSSYLWKELQSQGPTPNANEIHQAWAGLIRSLLCTDEALNRE